jgi:hypothetical protein
MAIDKSGTWWVGSESHDIQEYLTAYTSEDGGYATTSYRPVVCSCGSERFRLDRARSVTRRTCPACGQIKLICHEAEDWEESEADEGSEPYSCIDCASDEVNVMVGFANYGEVPEFDGVKWFYVGVRCAGCGILGCFNDGKIGRGPAADVYKSI